MMKVLFTASTYSHIVNFHLPYLLRFQKAGWAVHVACGGQAMEIPYADKLIDLPLKKTYWAPENFKSALILRRQIQSEKYAFVCTHTSLAAFFTRLALHGLKKRPAVANMVHGYLFDDEASQLKRSVLLAAERLTAPVTDLVLTMNQYDYETAVKYRLGKKVTHIPGVGVDFSRFSGLSVNTRTSMRQELGILNDAFVLIYAAEFSVRKSQAVLIHALKQLPRSVMLVLAGDGALRQECQDLARQLNLSGRVVFPGQLSQISSWYAMADAAVSASRSEGLPFNIMEAMYAGLPVVASDVKGHRDLIAHGETGLLYPYGNVCACAKQVSCLLDSKILQKKLADNAREIVKDYDIEWVLPKVWAEYTTVFSSSTA